MPTSMVRTLTCAGSAISGAGWATMPMACLPGMRPTARMFPFFIAGAELPGSFLFYVVTKQHILIAQVKLAADDDGMRPTALVAPVRLLESALLVKAARGRFDENHGAFAF